MRALTLEALSGVSNIQNIKRKATYLGLICNP